MTPTIVVAAAIAVVALAASTGKMNGAVETNVVAIVPAVVAAATARNPSPWAGTGSLPVGRVSSPPSRNTTSTSGSRAVHNCHPSPTSYRPRVRASTDSRPSPYGIPCSQHHPPICVFLPSPADPSLHNSLGPKHLPFHWFYARYDAQR